MRPGRKVFLGHFGRACPPWPYWSFDTLTGSEVTFAKLLLGIPGRSASAIGGGGAGDITGLECATHARSFSPPSFCAHICFRGE